MVLIITWFTKYLPMIIITVSIIFIPIEYNKIVLSVSIDLTIYNIYFLLANSFYLFWKNNNKQHTQKSNNWIVLQRKKGLILEYSNISNFRQLWNEWSFKFDFLHRLDAQNGRNLDETMHLAFDAICYYWTRKLLRCREYFLPCKMKRAETYSKNPICLFWTYRKTIKFYICYQEQIKRHHFVLKMVEMGVYLRF